MSSLSPRRAVLLTCDPDSRPIAVEELGPLLPTDAVWLDPGIALGEAPAGFDAFAEAIHLAAPAFVRHLAPVDFEVGLTAAHDDLPVLEHAAARLVGRLDPAETFSVQTRILGEGKLPYRKVMVNERLSTALAGATGARMDARNPVQVVSVLCTPTKGFLGLSLAAQNRSSWPGGMHRLKDLDGQISRAEHKLEEALTVFGLALPSAGKALDLGAAPGGWTRVLRQHGLAVTAVDPADLDPRLLADQGIVHVRQKVQDYRDLTPRFSVIVNDLRMDPADSVDVMVRVRPMLLPGGVAVQTLKLPEEHMTPRRTLDTIRAALARLAEHYTVLGARHLYHNRSEVTVALSAPG